MTARRPTSRLVPAMLAAVATLAACHEANPVAPPTPEGELASDAAALACTADDTCPGGGVCDLATRTCVGCSSDADCGAGRCDALARVCVQCLADDECATGACHPTRHLCVGCWDDAQCGGGVCHPDRLTCVECLRDADCAAPSATAATDVAATARCNLETFGCTGGCATDAQCDDGAACTTDRCVDGACQYDKIADCGCGGSTNPCPCTSAPPTCPIGTKPVDTDADGCGDACVCASGALVGPDGACPCPSAIACAGGLVPSDLDGDGCPETCTKPCATDCDCAAQGLVADVPCALACAACGPFVACVEGACTGACGVATDACACPPAPACGPLETAFDANDDGCNDTCACVVAPDPTTDQCGCPFEVGCPAGSHPVDADLDGCGDACACDDASRAPAADGTCCTPLACPTGTVPADTGGDLCADACVCADGREARPTSPHCACVTTADCPVGAKPVDDDGDQCADRCACADGASPGPAGCVSCLATCPATTAAWAVYVDVDRDGCYDAVDACPVGERPAKSQPTAGCPDVCAACPAPPPCPLGASAVDGDGDNCPDTCRCGDGSFAPTGGCGCPAVVTCKAPAAAVDRDGDGCADGCALGCASDCDCTASAADATGTAPSCAASCTDCRVAGTCVEGFCAFDCAATTTLVACPTSPDVTATVCGCDGKTYASACEAAKAGTSTQRSGACETSGCATDADCKSGELCELPTGVCAGAIDGGASARGSCVAKPSACVDGLAPVCGCDGKTYPNDCDRRQAGTARMSLGACP